MIRGLLTFGLKRRPIIMLGLLLFIGGGLVAFSKLNIEAYPNPAPVILEITAQSPGLSAEEMERYYTIPMEVGLAPTPGVAIIRSTSFYGLSFVRVTFKYGIDYYFAVTQANISLQQNVSLPNNVLPQIQGSSLVGEVYRYQVVGSPHFGLSNLRTVQDWIVQRRLMTVEGVVQVNTWGGTTKQYEVEIDLNKLDAYNVTLQQVVSAIGNANVAQSNGIPIQLKDVATVRVGYVPRLGKAGRDSEDDVVAAIVVMNRTLHTNDVVPRIQAAVTKLNVDGTLPPGVKLVPFYDRTSLVQVTTHTVLHNLMFGCLLVFLIQWTFLGDLRSAIIVGINIPFALFFSIIILVLVGQDANLLSIGAVDFGIIIDSAVILVENIFRNFQGTEEHRRQALGALAAGRLGADPTREAGSTWTDRLRLIYISALQVDKAVLFSTAVTVAAFVPLFTMEGVEGQIFNPMARTYGFALVGALIATFTITPALASLLLPEHIRETETIVVRVLRSVYTPILRLALAARWGTVAVGAAFLVVTGVLTLRLGTEFLPHLEEGNLWIRASMPPTISLDAGMKYVTKIREILLRHPEVVTVVSQHGRPDNGSDAAGFNNAEFFAPLKPFDEWSAGRTKETLIQELQAEFAQEFVGIDFNFSQYIQDNIEEGLSGVKGSNSVKIIGRDLATLENLADQVLREMRQIRGVTDLGVFRVLGQPNLNVKINRDAAARYGLNTGDVTTVIQAAMGGQVATTLLESDRQFSVTVRLAPEYREDIQAVRALKVGYQTPAGLNAYIPLTELAKISLDTGASYIYHERNERFIPVKFSVRDRDLGGTVAEAQERIARNVKLPNGYRIEWAGEFESLQLAKQRLAVIVPISLVLIMVLLYGLFNSLRDSLLALVGIPFAIAGGVIGLLVTGLDFGISAAVGFVSLFGVSVMNGILIITYYNEVRGEGMGALDAMFHAATQRMRPMLMTALSACIGLFPAAISTGIGSQVQRPLAVVVVAGMLIGPVMLLVVAPALQVMFLGRETEQRPNESEAARTGDRMS